MRNFQRLDFWTRSHKLTLNIYITTRKFPKEELFGLTSQMRRSASSIPSNIAEGCGRRTVGDFRRFLDIASGSSSELEYQIILCNDLGYINDTIRKELINEAIGIRKMLYFFSEKLQTDS